MCLPGLKDILIFKTYTNFQPNFNGFFPQTRHLCALRKVSFQLQWGGQSRSDWALGRRCAPEQSGYPALCGNGCTVASLVQIRAPLIFNDKTVMSWKSLQEIYRNTQYHWKVQSRVAKSGTVCYGQVLASTAHTSPKDCMFSWIYSIILNHNDIIVWHWLILWYLSILTAPYALSSPLDFQCMGWKSYQAAGRWNKVSQQFAKLIIWCVAAILCLILGRLLWHAVEQNPARLAGSPISWKDKTISQILWRKQLHGRTQMWLWLVLSSSRTLSQNSKQEK